MELWKLTGDHSEADISKVKRRPVISMHVTETVLNLRELPSGRLCQNIHLIIDELENILVLTNGAAGGVKKRVSEMFLIYSTTGTHTLRKSRERSFSLSEIRNIGGVTHSHRFVSTPRLLLAIHTLSLEEDVRPCPDSFFFVKSYLFAPRALECISLRLLFRRR